MSKKPFSKIRMIKASALFIGMLLFILLIGSRSPFGVSFAEDTTDVTQPVIVKKATYQDSYLYERNFIGLIEAQQVSDAGFEIGGIIKSIKVDESDSVKKGDVLAELDTARLTARQNEAEASLKRAKANAKLAESTYNRFVKAWKAKTVSAQEKDEALEARDTTAAAVNVAMAQLESIEVDIAKSNLTAPFDGIVIRRMADEGTAVSAGQALLEVQQNANYDVRIGVTSKIASNLVKGDTKPIDINGERYNGVITSILPVKGQFRTVDVILSMQEKNTITRPGDVVRLPIEYETKQRGFWVPLTALKEGNRGLWSLYVAAENVTSINDGNNDASPELILTAQRRSIEVHYTGNETAYVSGTVKEGEPVVIEGAAKLVPGQQIRIAESDDE